MFSISKHFKIFISVTLTILAIGVGSMIMKGFNLGIDFKGGNIIDITFEKAVTVSDVRNILDKRKNMGYRHALARYRADNRMFPGKFPVPLLIEEIPLPDLP